MCMSEKRPVLWTAVFVLGISWCSAAAQSCSQIAAVLIRPSSSDFNLNDVAVARSRNYDVLLYNAQAQVIDGQNVPVACSPATITLTSSAGGGVVTFGDGTETMGNVGISLQPVQIEGKTVSKTAGDVGITVGGMGFKSQNHALTVVGVTFAVNGKQGSAISDGGQNTPAGTQYQSDTSQSGAKTFNLGRVFLSGSDAGCGIGQETTAQLQPANYQGAALILRQILTGEFYVNGAGQQILPQNDLSPMSLQTNQADANGRLYDFDAPGTDPAVSVTTRKRTDYTTNVVFGLRQLVATQIGKGNTAGFLSVALINQTTMPVATYSRSSCTSAKTGQFNFVTDVPGDNMEANGCTPLSAGLTGSCL